MFCDGAVVDKVLVTFRASFISLIDPATIRCNTFSFLPYLFVSRFSLLLCFLAGFVSFVSRAL